MDIGRTIRALRRRRGLTQGDLAKAVGVTQGMVSQWENGRAHPEFVKLPLLAEVLGVPEHELLQELRPADGPEAQGAQDAAAGQTPYLQGLDYLVAQAQSLERIRVYARASATVPLVTLGRVHAGSFSDEELIGYRVEVSPALLEAHPDAQACVVEGDCIDRVAPEGSIVVFDPSLEPTNGRIVIVETEDHKALIRRWHKGNNVLVLYADSHHDYPDIVLSGADLTNVIGTVVHVDIPDDML